MGGLKMVMYLEDINLPTTEFKDKPEITEARVELLHGINEETPDEVIESALDLLEVRAVNRMLVAACWEALQLRGLMKALNDPLMLEGEKRALRETWKKIELSIRAAIERADSLERKK
jgi:hypothetical protein